MKTVGWRPAELMSLPWNEFLAELDIAHALENGR